MAGAKETSYLQRRTDREPSRRNKFAPNGMLISAPTNASAMKCACSRGNSAVADVGSGTVQASSGGPAGFSDNVSKRIATHGIAV